jgi:predicted Zn-ribbon and HTH transcriptional regulator
VARREERGRTATVREALRDVLAEGPATAKDLSRRVGVPERDVPHHLEHLARSLRARGERLALEPPECLDCGFDFPRRERAARPGRCPRCHGRRITLPRFRVEPDPRARARRADGAS